MFETRIVPATSPTVSRRSPTNGRRLPICHILHKFNCCHDSHTFNLCLAPPSCNLWPRGARTVTTATVLVKHIVGLLSALERELHKWDSQLLPRIAPGITWMGDPGPPRSPEGPLRAEKWRLGLGDLGCAEGRHRRS